MIWMKFPVFRRSQNLDPNQSGESLISMLEVMMLVIIWNSTFLFLHSESKQTCLHLQILTNPSQRLKAHLNTDKNWIYKLVHVCIQLNYYCIK